MVGGPVGNHVVRYYEQSGLSPLCYRSFSDDTGQPAQCWELPCGSGLCLQETTVSPSDVGVSQDLFVVEFFEDAFLGVRVAIMYGYSQAGTLAAGYYFSTKICPSLAAYLGQWYVFRWADANGNGYPDASDTFSLVARG